MTSHIIRLPTEKAVSLYLILELENAIKVMKSSSHRIELILPSSQVSVTISRKGRIDYVLFILSS